MNDASPFGVIFDMDGVLVDSAEPHFRSWQRLAEELGRPVSRDQFAGTFGRQNRDIIPILFGAMTDDRMHVLSERKEELYRAMIRDNPPIIAGAVELVEQLSRAGIRLAVGSSGPRANIELVLDATRVREQFAAIICAEDVSRGKPDPQVFQLAASRLRLPPSQCVVIEDAPAGIQAAKSAGMFAVAVLTTHPREAFEGPDASAKHDQIVNRLSDLSPSVLQALCVSGSGGAEACSQR